MTRRKDIAATFAAAKKLVAVDGAGCTFDRWNGQGDKPTYEFICHALDKVTGPGVKAARTIIRKRFGRGHCSPTIYGWLYKQGIDACLLTDDAVQAYKHRWLDSVIKEFSK